MLEWAANWYATRKHLTENLGSQPAPTSGGRAGESLCRSAGMHVGVCDQEAITVLEELWGSSRKRHVVTELQPCQLCLRAARKAGLTIPK